MTSDGMSKANLICLNGEKLVPEMKSRLLFSLAPRWLRRMIAPMLQKIGEERAAFLSTWTAGLCGYQWLWILHEKDHVEQKMFNFWREKEFDAIITPGAGIPALKHGTSGELSLACCYLWISNMFNLPAGIVPVTRVQKGEDNYGKDDTIFRDHVLYPQAVDAMKGSEGLPVGIQVLTLPYEDEKCLGVMKLLEKKFPPMLKLEEK
jgi:fatty acid amide hydrolase